MKLYLCAFLLPIVVGGFQGRIQRSNTYRDLSLAGQKSSNNNDFDAHSSGADGGNSDTHYGRRSFLSSVGMSLCAAATTLVAAPQMANAGIDPSMLKSLQVEGDDAGATTRLRQIDAIKNPASDTVDKPWEDLASGVSYREYREGRGDAVVQDGSKVAVEMTIRMQSFATAQQPGGLKYFSTKEDTEFNEYAFTVGTGAAPPGLEEGMMGMKKGGLRRIQLPSTAVFKARDAGQLPLPTTKDGKRLFERLFKTEATLLFEVLVTRVK